MVKLITSESLPVKYRPTKFKDVVGQQHIIRQIEGMIKAKNIPNAMLLCGPSGTGKTTLAKAIATNINGSEEDTTDHNIADTNGIDHIRSIREKIKTLPKNIFRFVIFDEMHKATPQAISALLKILEEPPKHVVFILCTNEPEKLPATVLNRCRKLQLDIPSEEDINKCLNRVYKKEKLDFGKHKKKIFKHIIEASNCIPRDAIEHLGAVKDTLAASKNVKEALIFANIAANPELEKIALRFMYYLYKDNIEAAIKAIYSNKDGYGLFFKCMDLNRYLIALKTDTPTYKSPIRARLVAKLDVSSIKLNKILKIHNNLYQLNKDYYKNLDSYISFLYSCK